ncbi:putative acetylornithine aminotransferase [Morchella conica CCBAS932]|uniref:Putative acetylornithine aminotransferase n=1 Tax=Morchella conica CCBAS932 TaxID=1392247 RepID=A0A3N4KRG8_9PEZI|nr:putative acetylornithine aminotransferase [Morchella conica CCBAS932]
MFTALSTAVEALKAHYTTSNPISHAQHNSRLSHLPAGNTRSLLSYPPFPLCVRSAAGATITSVDGAAYTDFLCEYSAGLFGHSHPVILAALRNALDNGVNFGAVNELEGELAAALRARFEIDKIRFTNSATEASIMALAVAKVYTGRKKILVFSGGYHGGPLGFAGGVSAPHNIPHEYVIAPYDDIPRTAAQLSQLPPDTLAAVLVEPMLGSGGCIPASIEFLQYLRTAATELGAVLIFDEAMTSRLHWGGLQKKLDIKPDMTVLGKYLAGGMSFGAFGGRGEIMELFSGRLTHAGTFNNNVLSMAGGVAAGLLTAQILDAMNVLGDEMRVKVEGVLEGKTGGKVGISGMGSLMAFKYSGRDEVETGLVRELMFFHLLGEGLYIAYRGFMSLSIVHERSHVDAFVGAVERFVKKYGEMLRE